MTATASPQSGGAESLKGAPDSTAEGVVERLGSGMRFVRSGADTRAKATQSSRATRSARGEDSASAGPQAIARGFLEAESAVLGGLPLSELPRGEIKSLSTGHIVRYGQTHGGLEVVGGETLVRVDGAGEVRWAASGARVIADNVSLDPRLSSADAVAVLGRAGGYRAEALVGIDNGRAAELVLFAPPSSPRARLAYRVALPLDMGRMAMMRGVVDADSGVVLAIDNMVRRQAQPTCASELQLGYIYEENPTETPTLECVSLAPYLAPDAETLANEDVAVFNCIDNNGCRTFSNGDHHFCDLAVLADANADGDFTDHDFESNEAEEDSFAEVQMFYHVNKAYEKARELGGFDTVEAKPLTAIVNFRAPSFEQESACTSSTYTGTEPLQRFENALFVPGGGLFPGFPDDDAIIFGQGEIVDYAYDGDVVYHEFGHAVMNKVAPALGFYLLDIRGVNSMPAGMHESYADLMTMFVTDDPEIGEYAARGFGDELTAIRNIDNDNTCPTDLFGESHLDSEAFSGAIWEAREKIASSAEDKVLFDKAVFAAQQALGQFDDFGSAAVKTSDEIALAFGNAARDVFDGVFRERGILQGTASCNGRVRDGRLEQSFMYMLGTDAFTGFNFVPGPVQYLYEITEDAQSFDVEIGISIGDRPLFGPGDESQLPSMALVVLPGSEQLIWDLDGSDLVAENSTLADLTFTELSDRPGFYRATGSVTGRFSPGSYHLQLVNKGPTWQVGQVRLSYTARPPDSGGGGCGIAAPGGGGGTANGGVLLLLVLGAGLMLRRQRYDRREMR